MKQQQQTNKQDKSVFSHSKENEHADGKTAAFVQLVMTPLYPVNHL